MDVYVIYKFSDYEKVEKKLEKIKNEVENISFYHFSPDCKQKNWHNIAKKKIKKCNLVLFFDFFDGKNEVSYKHVKWELDQAEKNNKKILVCKNNGGSYSTDVYDKDYSEQNANEQKYETKSFEEILSVLKKESEWCLKNNLINNGAAKDIRNKDVDFSSEDKSLLLEQYRMMIETSEKLMERRQAMVNLYITICTALIAFIGASFGFGDLLVSSIIAFLSGIIIIVLCYNWRSALNDYELNNSGKFEVINQIEKHLPADMFECEYKHNKQKGIVSYSSREKILPLIFTFFGVALIVFSVILLIINYSKY